MPIWSCSSLYETCQCFSLPLRWNLKSLAIPPAWISASCLPLLSQTLASQMAFHAHTLPARESPVPLALPHTWLLLSFRTQLNGHILKESYPSLRLGLVSTLSEHPPVWSQQQFKTKSHNDSVNIWFPPDWTVGFMRAEKGLSLSVAMSLDSALYKLTQKWWWCCQWLTWPDTCPDVSHILKI